MGVGIEIPVFKTGIQPNINDTNFIERLALKIHFLFKTSENGESAEET